MSAAPADVAVRARIMHGDAFQLVKSVKDETVDLILTSPPYWGLRTYGHDHNPNVLEDLKSHVGVTKTAPSYSLYRQLGGVLGLEPYPEWYVAHLVEWFELARPKVRPSGSVWVNLGDTYFARWASIRDDGRQGLNPARTRRRTPSGGYLVDKQLLLIPARFAIAMQSAGWILRNDLIWSKPNPIPGPQRDRLRATHEHWFHFVRRPSRGRASYYYDVSELEEARSDVITAATSSSGTGHSATFPGQLVRPRIASTCPAGGLVLDPFCGSGTTIREAVSMGRRAIGFELSPDFAAAAAAAVDGAGE